MAAKKIAGSRGRERHDLTLSGGAVNQAELEFTCRENLTIHERVLLLEKLVWRYLEEHQ